MPPQEPPRPQAQATLVPSSGPLGRKVSYQGFPFSRANLPYGFASKSTSPVTRLHRDYAKSCDNTSGRDIAEPNRRPRESSVVSLAPESRMTFCPDCGTELSKIDNFCGNCGSKNQPPAVDLAQKYMGSVVYAALCLLFLPIGGLILDIVVSYVLGIFHLNPKLVDNLSASPYFALPIALGLATGFYLNRQNVRFGDLFAWLAPAAWFT